MDRDKVTKPTAQIGFIKFVLLPMFEQVALVRTSSIVSKSLLAIPSTSYPGMYYTLRWFVFRQMKVF